MAATVALVVVLAGGHVIYKLDHSEGLATLGWLLLFVAMVAGGFLIMH